MKNVTNAKGIKMAMYETKCNLQDELCCNNGYVDDVNKDDKNKICNHDDISYKDVGSCKDDDTSYKDVGSCKDDDTSYRNDGSCKDNSTLCRNDIIMKSPMWPRQQTTKTDDNDCSRNLIGNNDEVVDLCSSDDSEDDNDKQ